MPDRHPADDPLDERLAALSTGPVPPLVGAAEVRGRGQRRRRRQQGALACAAVLVAASIGGTAALLSGTGGQDALRIAAPTPAPSATASPTPTSTPPAECEELLGVPPGTDGDVVVLGGGDQSVLECEFAEAPPSPEPAPAPSAAPSLAPDPTPAATPSTTGDLTWDLDAGFLSPEQAGQVEQPGWSVDDAHQPAPGPLLDPCGTGVFPGEPVESVERAMGSEREAGGSRLVQEVLRYPSEQQAADAFDAFAARVEQCPEAAAVEGEGVNRFEVVGQVSVQGSRALLVQVQPCGTQGDCTAHFRSYLMLAQDGDGLTDAFYGLSEDGDPFEAAKDVLDAVAAQLVGTVRG